MIMIAVTQYTYKYINHKYSINSSVSFFSKVYSAYYLHGRLNLGMILQLFLRALVVLFIRTTIAYVYIYSFKGHVNIGIIATIYQCSAIGFTLLIFWVFYNQKLTSRDLIAFVFVFISVGSIAYAG